MTPFIVALTLMAAAPAPDQGGAGEPLPPGAPTDSYELSAWCYGALDEYLQIYDKVKPDLRDIDRLFGTSVVEADPYQSDMAAAQVELKMIGQSVTDAEKASPQPIAPRGVSAMRLGRAIWSVAETKTNRELARAWLTWALPDRCDSNAHELTQRSLLLGQALGYNASPPATPPAPDAAAAPSPNPTQTPDAGAGPGSATTPSGALPSTAPAPDTAVPAAAAPSAPSGGDSR